MERRENENRSVRVERREITFREVAQECGTLGGCGFERFARVSYPYENRSVVTEFLTVRPCGLKESRGVLSFVRRPHLQHRFLSFEEEFPFGNVVGNRRFAVGGNADGDDGRIRGVLSKKPHVIPAGEIRNECHVLKVFRLRQHEIVEDEKFRIALVRILVVQGEQIHYRNGERGSAFFNDRQKVREPLMSKKHGIVTVLRQISGKSAAELVKYPDDERLRDDVRSIFGGFFEALWRNEMHDIRVMAEVDESAV